MTARTAQVDPEAEVMALRIMETARTRIRKRLKPSGRFTTVLFIDGRKSIVVDLDAALAQGQEMLHKAIGLVLANLPMDARPVKALALVSEAWVRDAEPGEDPEHPRGRPSESPKRREVLHVVAMTKGGCVSAMARIGRSAQKPHPTIGKPEIAEGYGGAVYDLLKAGLG